MDEKVIAIAFSDLHINLWAKFNQNNKRTLDSFRVLSIIADECEKHKCPALFCGDMLHKPENLDQGLYEIICEEFEKLNLRERRVEILAISGNHDIKKVSRIGIKPFSWLKLLEQYGVSVIDYREELIGYDFNVFGVPYIDNNVGISEYISKLRHVDKNSILLLHTDYPGAKDTDGREIDSVENLNLNVLNKFGLVLCGHIHKPQRLSKKVYMIGAPIQQRRTDKDCKLGYWKIYSDLSMKFVELKDFPKFIDVESEDEVKEDGNYYTILPKKSSNIVNTDHKITKQLTKKSLAKRYLKEKGIKDKAKKELLIETLKKVESC